METHPNEAPQQVPVHFIEFLAVKTILLKSSMKRLALKKGWNEKTQTFGEWMKNSPKPLSNERDEFGILQQHTSALSFINQSFNMTNKLEQQLQIKLLNYLSNNSPSRREENSTPKFSSSNDRNENTDTSSSSKTTLNKNISTNPDFQIYTCIDDRECSFRRHLEKSDSYNVETFGLAGFFGVPIRYKPL